MKKIVFIIFILAIGCQENFSDLVEYRNVSGEIVDEVTLEPIVGARITTNPISELKFSNENGVFILDSLSSSIYSIRVLADGYNTNLSSFNLDDIQNSDLLILMEESSFVTVPPSEPYSPEPPNISVDQDLSIVLRWSADDENDSLRYEVLFFRPEMVEPEVLASQILDTTALVKNLQFNTAYFWQVKVSDTDGNVVLGPVWSFKTKAFPEDVFRYAFTRSFNGYDQIFIGDDNQASFQLTNSLFHHWKPTFSPQRNKIAYLSNVGGDVQIFTMDKNGENIQQVTQVRPLKTKSVLKSAFCWSEDGERIIYMDFDKILSITKSGTGLFEYPFDAQGDIITSIDYTPLNNGRFIITTEKPSTKVSKMFLYEIESDSTRELIDSVAGQFLHAQFSPSGRQIIYSFNAANDFSTSGVPLNKRIFYLNLETNQPPLDISAQKEGGTADSNPRFSRNGDFIVYNNGASDDIGQIHAFITDFQDALDNQNATRDTLFANAMMIDWE